MDRSVALVVAVLPIAAALAAVLAPLPAPPAASVPTEGTDLSGTGSLTLNRTDLAWFDLAYEVDEDTDILSVNVTVTVDWPKRQDADRQQIWLCGFFGTHFHGKTRWEPPNESWSTGCYRNLPGTGTWSRKDNVAEYDVGVAGRRVVDQQAPHPYATMCDEYCDDQLDRWRVRDAWFEHVNYDHLLEERDRPVVHVLFYAGGLAPDWMRIEANWTDTPVTWTAGGPEDTFGYFRDDFSHDLYARAEVMPSGGAQVGDGGVLETTFMENQREVYFRYDTVAGGFCDTGGVNDCYRQGFTRPDGSAPSPEEVKPRWREFSNQTGQWRFWYEQGDRHWEGDDGEVVLLEGTVFDLAQLPWQE